MAVLKGRRRSPEELQEAIAEAEAELRRTYGGELTYVEATAVRLMARLGVRVRDPRPGDDAVRMSEMLARLAGLLPPKKPGSAWNFDRLSDADLAELERIALKATTPVPGEDALRAKARTDAKQGAADASRTVSKLPLN